MIKLMDWEITEPGNVGTPGWWTLALTIRGKTPRPADRVFAAVEENPAADVCRVLVAAEYPDAGPEVVTPYAVTVHVTRPGVRRYVVAGETMSETVEVLTP
jgi:hypothetical protein